jgi:uncharacterized protein
LPLLYAKEVLDKDHNGSLSIQEASKDVTFQSIIGGNISLILTDNLPNGTKLLKPEYNPNKNAYINIDTELKPALIEKANHSSHRRRHHHQQHHQNHQVNVPI